MVVALVGTYGDLLAVLKDERRAHSLAVGRKAAAAASRIAPAHLRSSPQAACLWLTLGVDVVTVQAWMGARVDRYDEPLCTTSEPLLTRPDWTA